MSKYIPQILENMFFKKYGVSSGRKLNCRKYYTLKNGKLKFYFILKIPPPFFLAVPQGVWKFLDQGLNASHNSYRVESLTTRLSGNSKY